MWNSLLDIYTKFQIEISKLVQKSLENFLLVGQKLPNHDEKSVGIKTPTI